MKVPNFQFVGVIAATLVASLPCHFFGMAAAQSGNVSQVPDFMKPVPKGMRPGTVPTDTTSAPAPNPVVAPPPASPSGEDNNPFNAKSGSSGLQQVAPSPQRAAPPSSPALLPSYDYQPPINHTFGSPAPAVAPATPGGISLTKAAALRLPLNISLEGAYFKHGRLLLSGQEDANGTLDSALLLTSLRAACEARDPYFSLDPDSGSEWVEEVGGASKEFLYRIKGTAGLSRPVKGDKETLRRQSLFVRDILASRDFPQFWDQIALSYPELRSRLVFRPFWLHQTRMGYILYRADVLLKELASGASILETGPLRASNVDGYVSVLGRNISEWLLAQSRGKKLETTPKGVRFWFDIAPREFSPKSALSKRSNELDPDPQLVAVLAKHRLMPAESRRPPAALRLAKEGDFLDLSRVFPTMFVRRHDIAAGTDVPDDDPSLNSFASDINSRIEEFTNQYKELRALSDVVRAYIVAVHIINENSILCRKLKMLKLLDTEKVEVSLPEFHPTDLSISLVRYASGRGRFVQPLIGTFTLFQGGVNVGGRLFYSRADVSREVTPITASLKAEVSRFSEGTFSSWAWVGVDGRR